MPLDVEEWIRWAGDNAIGLDPIPAALGYEPRPPWVSFVPDLFDELDGGFTTRESLLSSLCHSLPDRPVSLATRFVAVSVYAVLELWARGKKKEAVECAEEVQDFLYPTVAGTADEVKEDLALVVRMTAVEDCPPEWRLIRWEILNAYLISDWERALNLYARAEQYGLLSPADICLFRAQFYYLRVFDEEIEEFIRASLNQREIRYRLESLAWEPRLYSLDDAASPDVGGLMLADGAFFERDDGRERPVPQRLLLSSAAQELEKASLQQGYLPPLYAALYARCCFELGRYHEAGRLYSGVLATAPCDRKNKLRKRAMLSAAAAYRKAANNTNALEILERASADFPTEANIDMLIAELKHESQLPGVSASLRSAIDKDPTKDTWLISELLASAEIFRDPAFASKAIEAWPEVFVTVDSLVAAYWPRYRALASAAKDKWQFGAYISTRETSTERKVREAAGFYADAVEIELREKVFAPFSGSQTAIVAQPEVREGRHGRFIEHFRSTGRLSLGQMTVLLTDCQNCREPICNRLFEWVRARFPRLLQQLEDLRLLTDVRNPGRHAAVTDPRAGRALDCARRFLEAVEATARPAARA